MPSYEFKIDEKSRAGSRFITRVKEEIQKAVFAEKAAQKLTQQAIAGKLGVNRSVVNRQVMGLENMTIRSVAELLWAIGWEPYFESRRAAQKAGQNEFEAEDTSGKVILLRSIKDGGGRVRDAQRMSS